MKTKPITCAEAGRKGGRIGGKATGEREGTDAGTGTGGGCQAVVKERLQCRCTGAGTEGGEIVSTNNAPNPGPGYRLLNPETDGPKRFDDEYFGVINGWVSTSDKSNLFDTRFTYRRRISEAEETVALINELLAYRIPLELHTPVMPAVCFVAFDGMSQCGATLLDALRAAAKAKREAR